MFTVCAIKSIKNNYVYVGLTKNLENRLARHNSGREKTTKPHRPFRLIRTENFKTWQEARNREKQLKSGYGKEFLKTLI